MPTAANWVRQNCKFAAPKPLPDPAFTLPVQTTPSLTTVGPEAAPSSYHQLLEKKKQVEEMERRMDRPKAPMPQAEEEGQLISDINDMNIPPREVFDRMAGDVRTMQEALTFVDHPFFPAFTEAYRKAFGDQPASDTARLLKQIESFLTNVAQDPKFAEILAKVKKQG